MSHVLLKIWKHLVFFNIINGSITQNLHWVIKFLNRVGCTLSMWTEAAPQPLTQHKALFSSVFFRILAAAGRKPASFHASCNCARTGWSPRRSRSACRRPASPKRSWTVPSRSSVWKSSPSTASRRRAYATRIRWRWKWAPMSSSYFRT